MKVLSSVLHSGLRFAVLVMLAASVAATPSAPYSLQQPVAPQTPGNIQPAQPSTSLPPATAQPEVTPSGPSSPAPITTCDTGGCWSGGERYRGGAGNTYLNKNGRLCQNSGGWMHCY